jgi:fermentation-respiration switch protein FrsA (DUF1100 family)
MAMTKKLFSINGLATELGRDRRTLAKRLDGVPPDGVLPGGHNGWHMTTVLASLEDKRLAPPSRDKLLGYAAAHRATNPVDQAIIVTALTLFYRIGLTAAIAAVVAGAPMKVVFALHNIMLSKFAHDVSDLLADLGVEGCHDADNAVLFELDAIEKVDWEVLAVHAEEKLDLQEWQSWAEARGSEPLKRRVDQT